MTPAEERGTLVLTLENAGEMFAGPPPGRTLRAPHARSWDDIGAVLGEPGVARVLRMLEPGRGALNLEVRIRDWAGDEVAAGLAARLRDWCQARIEANRDSARRSRRIGAYLALGSCAVLAIALFLSWLLLEDSLLGPPGPLRVLLSEAVVIAGWVALWRPIEMIFFDPIRSTLENRLLARLLALGWRFVPDRGESPGSGHGVP